MARIFVVLASAIALAGCAEAGSAVNTVATAGLAAAIGSATGSPLIGVPAGLAASFGVNQGVRYGQRRIEGNVQNAVAAAAGPLDVGQAATWRVTERLPLTGRSGVVQVARSFGESIPCKDVVLTIGDESDVYVATICQNKKGEWRWAMAEPAVGRWGNLQ
jgi:hypothetical protein